MTKILLGHSGFIGQSINKLFVDEKENFIAISSKEINLLEDNSYVLLADNYAKDTDIIMCMGLKKQYTSEIQNILRNGHGLNF